MAALLLARLGVSVELIERRPTVQPAPAVQDADGVTSRIRDRETDVVREVRSRYLIAADGAGSRVRTAVGIELLGPPRLQSFLMIHFRADLRPIVGEPPGSRRRMQATLADTAARARVAAAIERQAVHFDMPGLQLGFTYSGGAIVDEPGAAAPAGDPRTFRPSGRPGARLPHAWTHEADGHGSILDWVPLDRFLLLAGPDGAAWITAGAALEPAPIVARALRTEDLPDLPSWLDTAGIGPTGALLVRPDQHVAWRSVQAVDDPATTLRGVLATLLA